jgi:hypothetical protein
LFCSRTQEQVGLLLAETGGAYICDQFIEGMWEKVQEHQRALGRGSAAPEE